MPSSINPSSGTPRSRVESQERPSSSRATRSSANGSRNSSARGSSGKFEIRSTNEALALFYDSDDPDLTSEESDASSESDNSFRLRVPRLRSNRESRNTRAKTRSGAKKALEKEETAKYGETNGSIQSDSPSPRKPRACVKAANGRPVENGHHIGNEVKKIERITKTSDGVELSKETLQGPGVAKPSTSKDSARRPKAKDDAPKNGKRRYEFGCIVKHGNSPAVDASPRAVVASKIPSTDGNPVLKAMLAKPAKAGNPSDKAARTASPAENGTAPAEVSVGKTPRRSSPEKPKKPRTPKKAALEDSMEGEMGKPVTPKKTPKAAEASEKAGKSGKKEDSTGQTPVKSPRKRSPKKAPAAEKMAETPDEHTSSVAERSSKNDAPSGSKKSFEKKSGKKTVAVPGFGQPVVQASMVSSRTPPGFPYDFELSSSPVPEQPAKSAAGKKPKKETPTELLKTPDKKSRKKPALDSNGEELPVWPVPARKPDGKFAAKPARTPKSPAKAASKSPRRSLLFSPAESVTREKDSLHIPRYRQRSDESSSPASSVRRRSPRTTDPHEATKKPTASPRKKRPVEDVHVLKNGKSEVEKVVSEMSPKKAGKKKSQMDGVKAVPASVVPGVYVPMWKIRDGKERNGVVNGDTVDGAPGPSTSADPAHWMSPAFVASTLEAARTKTTSKNAASAGKSAASPRKHSKSESFVEESFVSEVNVSFDEDGLSVSPSKLDSLLKVKSGPSSVESTPERDLPTDKALSVPKKAGRSPRSPRGTNRYSPDIVIRQRSGIRSPPQRRLQFKREEDEEELMERRITRSSRARSASLTERNEQIIDTFKKRRGDDDGALQKAEKQGRQSASLDREKPGAENKRGKEGQTMAVGRKCGDEFSQERMKTPPRPRSRKKRKIQPEGLTIRDLIQVHGAIPADQALFSPVPESSESNHFSSHPCNSLVPLVKPRSRSRKRKERPPRKARAKSTVEGMPEKKFIRPEIRRYYTKGKHPLIPAGSTRRGIETPIDNVADLVPVDLPERSLPTLLAGHPMLLTQSTVVCEKWKHITTSKLLLRRSLIYSLAHRRLAFPAGHDGRPVIMKKRDCESIVQQLWERKNAPKTATKPLAIGYSYPVDVKIASFIFTRPPERHGSTSKKIDREQPFSIQVELAMVRKNPKKQIQRDILQDVFKTAPKMRAVCTGENTCIFEPEKLRVSEWKNDNFLVVNYVSQFREGAINTKSCAFNIRDIKDGNSNLEVKENYTFKVAVTKQLASNEKTNYQHVLIYPSGTNFQVREMAVIKDSHLHMAHACMFCSIRCDTLSSLLRHLDGLHPGIGYEYDPDRLRLYFWFAPESEFVRTDMVGLIDHWRIVRFKQNAHGKNILFPLEHGGKFVDGRMVLQWISQKRVPPLYRQPDALPGFNIKHLLQVYGVPVLPTRHLLHTNAVQTMPPTLSHMVDYDSDDDASWQDGYEMQKIYDFIDVSPQEQQFMCLWNQFTRRLPPIFSIAMRDLLCRFVQQHAVEIDFSDGFPAFCAQLSLLRRKEILTASECLEVISTYWTVLGCRTRLVGPPEKI